MDSLTEFKAIQARTKTDREKVKQVKQTKTLSELFLPVIAGSQEWIDRQTTWEIKRAKDDEEKEIKEKELAEQKAEEERQREQRQREKRKGEKEWKLQKAHG